MSLIDARDLTDPANHPLQISARAVKEILPQGYGFIIVASPFCYEAPKETDLTVRAEYVSNVCREDAIKILKTLLFRWGINDQWMKEAQ